MNRVCCGGYGTVINDNTLTHDGDGMYSSYSVKDNGSGGFCCNRQWSSYIQSNGQIVEGLGCKNCSSCN